MPIIWFGEVLLCLAMYVVLDGYDLGIGVAILAERDRRHRHEMLDQVAQAWDGNETWLVLLGVSLWAGLPLAFGTILPHAYLGLIVMLFSLIVRGVSVEMASQKPPAPRWQRVFGVASLTASLAQGFVAGTLAEKLTVRNGAFSGPAFGAAGWFPVLSAVTVACAYLALGYAYTKAKTTGDLRARAGRRGTVSTAAAAVLGAACLAAINGTAARLNLHDPARAIGFAGLLLFAAGGVVMALVTLRPASRYNALPISGLVTATVAVLIALVVARYPVLVPPALTVGGSTAPGATLDFLAVGIGLNVPLILFYNWYAHHAFRGRADAAPEGDVAHAHPGAIHDH